MRQQVTTREHFRRGNAPSDPDCRATTCNSIKPGAMLNGEDGWPPVLSVGIQDHGHNLDAALSILSDRLAVVGHDAAVDLEHMPFLGGSLNCGAAFAPKKPGIVKTIALPCCMILTRSEHVPNALVALAPAADTATT